MFRCRRRAVRNNISFLEAAETKQVLLFQLFQAYYVNS